MLHRWFVGWLALEQRIPCVSSIDFLSVFAFLETLDQGIIGYCTGAFLVAMHCSFHASRRFAKSFWRCLHSFQLPCILLR